MVNQIEEREFVIAEVTVSSLKFPPFLSSKKATATCRKSAHNRKRLGVESPKLSNSRESERLKIVDPVIVYAPPVGYP